MVTRKPGKLFAAAGLHRAGERTRLRFLDLLAEGGSGYHFFGRSAEEVVLVRAASGVGTGVA
jgi:hypothetical protein